MVITDLSRVDVNLLMLAAGAVGAIIMFIADLILYYPTNQEEVEEDHRSARSYFDKIDPGGTNLSESTMRNISIRRVMFGGALGPVAAYFYMIGFCGIFFGLQQQHHDDDDGTRTTMFLVVLSAISSIGLSLMMIIASVYHALFAYTAFISKLFILSREEKKELSSSNNHHLLTQALGLHQTYLLYLYKWAAIPGLIGSAAFVCCCIFSSRESSSSLTGGILYSRWTALLVPAMSAPIKKFLKRKSIGGIALCGGLTNLWNLCFFLSLGVSVLLK